MNKHFRSAVVLALLAGCASVTACSSKSGNADLGDDLAKDTGTAWVVYRDPRSNEVRFLAPMTPVSVGSGTPEAMARAFITHYSAALHGADDELRLTMTATDPHGDVHLRFEHVVPGSQLRVFDSGTTAHFTADGRISWAITDFHEDLANVERIATVSADAAAASGSAHLAASCGTTRRAAVLGTSELGVLANEDIHPTLAYRLTFDLDSDACLAPTVFVDAKTGTPLLLEERAHSLDALVRGSRGQMLGEADAKAINVSADTTSNALQYLMVSETPRPQDPKVRTHAGNFPVDEVLTSPDPAVWDEVAMPNAAANDAHFYTTRALAFLRPFTDGFEVAGAVPIVPLTLDTNVWVHYNAGTSNGFNAYGVFDETRKMDTVRFGDGDPAHHSNALPFASAYDVVAHEVTHLITQHTSKLAYQGESGALNESFSDVMGASAEHAESPDPLTNFVMGERLFGRPGGHAQPGDQTAMRDMEFPDAYGQPDRYENLVKRCTPTTKPDGDKNDFCDVHTNSGIPNRAFSLMVAGGAVTNNAGTITGVPVGAGWEASANVWYWSITQLDKSASFAVAALAQWAVSRAFNANDAVTCAWLAVGVVSRNDLPWAIYPGDCAAPAPAPAPAPNPTPQPTNICNGHGNNPVCDPTTAYQAAICAGGNVVGAVTCSDQTLTCRPTSDTDPTATVDPFDGLSCK